MGIGISCGGDSNGRGTPRVSHGPAGGATLVTFGISYVFSGRRCARMKRRADIVARLLCNIFVGAAGACEICSVSDTPNIVIIAELLALPHTRSVANDGVTS